jgi:3-deoxy-manno-octulosonate cytidylyltransferase (CMP-KDO synthetase)
MSFTVLIPARMASVRLPGKPLADIAGIPMVVRVARQASLSAAHAVVVAADHLEIVAVCQAHGVRAVLTREDHATGSDRLAQACTLLNLAPTSVVVNVQGDEPFIAPELINACADLLQKRPDCAMSTVAHPIESAEEFSSPHVVKVVLDSAGHALYFSRAPIPFCREAFSSGGKSALPQPLPLRHVGIYAYTARFVCQFPQWPISSLEATEALEQLRVLWQGQKIAVHVSHLNASRGVDTPEDLARARQIANQCQGPQTR